MVTKKNSQAGFSLVELMVVVAIIGVLATIAIPRVNRFIAKSRQSEAQVNLSSLYTFNKNFYVEFQGYTTAFTAMGFRPEGNLRYNVGWSTAAAGPNNYLVLKTVANYTGSTNTVTQCATAMGTTNACVSLRGADNAAPPAINASAIDANFQTFTANARANLIQNSGTDAWTITQNKALVNTTDGTVEAN